MDAVAQQNNKYRLGHLPTDESKIAKLEDLFKARKHKGEFFLPDSRFYSLDLNGMAEAIFDWIGLETKDKISISYADDFEELGLKDVAGLYKENEGVHYIFLNSKKVHNPFQVGAVLAHELMHYILMGVCNYMLEDNLQNEKFTDIATVFTGLGVIVTNGFEFSSGWARTIGALMLGFISFNVQSLYFGYYKPKQYAHMLKDFADTFHIRSEEYAGYLLPWTRHFLPTSVKTASRLKANKSDVVQAGQRQVWKKRAISTVILLVLIPIAVAIHGNSGTSSSNIPSDVQQQLTDKKAEIDSLRGQVDSCTSDINARYNSVDQYDSAAVDQYNADRDSCNSQRDQLNSDIDSYNSLLDQYK